MSAEESSPVTGSSYEPESSMRSKLVIVGVALLFVLGAYAYVGTRDRSLDIEASALVSQQQEDGLICCFEWIEHEGEPLLLVITRELEGQYRTVVIRVMEVEEDGSFNEINAIGSPFPGMLPTNFSVVDETAYIPLEGEEGSGVWAVDLSDPAWPETVGFTETADGITRQLSADGDLLAINHTSQFALVNISNRHQPEVISRIEQPESGVISLELIDQRLFVNDAVNDEFRIYHLDTSDEPTSEMVLRNPDGTGEVVFSFGAEDAEDRLNLTAPAGKFLSFRVDGDLVYLASSDLGVQILDVSNTESPEVIARLELPDRAVRLARDGDRLYVLGASEGTYDELTYTIHTVDVSNPEAPELLDTIDGFQTEPGIQTLTATGDGRVVLGLFESILVFDVSE
ncbi:MAG: hypothetical protein EA415_06505 [Sphaerobacteraceae bacterium]|nr:MAG: hypothetical protein EA415_06505 [Sphaerobacteraceae bacterium]